VGGLGHTRNSYHRKKGSTNRGNIQEPCTCEKGKGRGIPGVIFNSRKRMTNRGDRERLKATNKQIAQRVVERFQTKLRKGNKQGTSNRPAEKRERQARGTSLRVQGRRRNLKMSRTGVQRVPMGTAMSGIYLTTASGGEHSNS